MIVGQPRSGTTAVNLPADRVRGLDVTLSAPAHLAELAVLLDGLGPGVGSALVRGVVFDAAGMLVARGDEVVVADGAPAEWVRLPMGAAAGMLLAVGAYRVGMHIGGVTNCARTFVDSPGVSWEVADTYADGTASISGGAGPAALTGSAAASAAATGTVRATARLTGTATAGGSMTATLRAGPSLAGSAAAAGAASGTLTAASTTGTYGTGTYGAATYG